MVAKIFLANRVDLGKVFGKFSVRISVGTPAILTEAFRNFSQSLQTNARILPQIGHDRFLSNTFPCINHLML
jgi:hypothetical protein